MLFSWWTIIDTSCRYSIKVESGWQYSAVFTIFVRQDYYDGWMDGTFSWMDGWNIFMLLSRKQGLMEKHNGIIGWGECIWGFGSNIAYYQIFFVRIHLTARLDLLVQNTLFCISQKGSIHLPPVLKHSCCEEAQNPKQAQGRNGQFMVKQQKAWTTLAVQ